MTKYLNKPYKEEIKSARRKYTFIMIICFFCGVIFPLTWLFAIIAGIGAVRSQGEMDRRFRLVYNILIPLMIALSVYSLLVTFSAGSRTYPMGPWIVYASTAVGILTAIYGFIKSRE